MISMETSIIIAGFGGQGVLFAGQLLAYGAMDDGRFVTWIPSYGPEMRGGTANCTVVIGDGPIGSPIVTNPDIALVLNQPSFEKYEPLVKPGGLLVVNESLVTAVSERDDIDVIYVPGNKLAEQAGSVKMLNVVLLGALLTKRPLLSLDVLQQALNNHLPENKQHMLAQNAAALRQGADYVGESSNVEIVGTN
jgi:2-oxoglutarate ferredoxin oxidoreductase subunit gamma